MTWPLLTLGDMLQELQDDAISTTAQLRGCGNDHLEDLRLATQGVMEESSRKVSLARLVGLIDTAYDKMKNAKKGSPITCWRRLYTDASIFLALADVAFLPEDAKDAISRLDRAIIIAGSAGEGRLELIYVLIAKIQADYFTSSLVITSPPFIHLLSSDSPSTTTRANCHLDCASHEVPCLTSVPSLSSFRNERYRQPFVLRGFAADWPALLEGGKHSWNSVPYLCSIAGPGRLVPVEIGRDYRTDDWSQALMPWEEFLSRIICRAQNDSEVLYLAQHSLMAQFPALRDDIVVPDYVYSCPSAGDFPGYSPPSNEDQLVLNVWLGPKGTLSPAHTDPFFNIYVQVVGFKTVWLAPPEISPSMDAFPPSGLSSHPAANTVNPSMSNTSQLDVFSSEHPLSKDVVKRASCITLGPGDILFFPPGWWHAMKSESTSLSVSMWF